MACHLDSTKPLFKTMLEIGPLASNFSEILIEIQTFSLKKIHFKVSCGKLRPFCFGLNVLNDTTPVLYCDHCIVGTQIARFIGPTWGPPGSCRPQMGPMLARWTLLSGYFTCYGLVLQCISNLNKIAPRVVTNILNSVKNSRAFTLVAADDIIGTICALKKIIMILINYFIVALFFTYFIIF